MHRVHTAFKTFRLCGDYATSLDGSAFLGGRSAESLSSVGLARGIAALILYGSGSGRSLCYHKGCDGDPNHWSRGHRIWMETPDRANCPDDCWHDGCPDSSSSKDAHGSTWRTSAAKHAISACGFPLVSKQDILALPWATVLSSWIEQGRRRRDEKLAKLSSWQGLDRLMMPSGGSEHPKHVYRLWNFPFCIVYVGVRHLICTAILFLACVAL